MKQGAERENNFGMIRLMAAVMVIVGHMFTLVGQAVPKLLWNTVNSVGVGIFFCIGGYLITLSWLREPNFKTYMVKRITRIFPPLIVCIALTVYVAGPLLTSLSAAEYFKHPMIEEYMKNCRLFVCYSLPGVFEQNVVPGVVNGSLWCLPVEFLMYLVIPVYISIGSRLSKSLQTYFYGIVTVAAVLAGCVWTTWFYDTHFLFYRMDFSQIMQIMPYYFVGSLFAVCDIKKILNVQNALLLMFLSACLLSLPKPFSYFGQYTLMPYVILSLAMAEKPAFAEHRVFRFIPHFSVGGGTNVYVDISYGMFLFSFVIQQSLVDLFLRLGWTLNVWALIALSIILSMLMGALTERLVERPAARLCRQILRK